MTDLTDRQQQFYDWILAYAKLNGGGPSVRELCDAFSMAPNGVMGHLRPLEAKGWISGVVGSGNKIRYYRPTCGYTVEGV